MNILRVALLLLIAQGFSSQQPTASIQGTVARQGASEPLTKATVELQNVDAGDSVVVTITTDDGRFVLRNIQPGRYRLVATRSGFVRTSYGQRTRNGPGATITLGPGQQLAGIRLEMQPTGAIHGHIYDRGGKPVINATVQALKPTYRDGRRTLTIQQTTITNDLGEYRLYWLAPGQYFVNAAPSGAKLPPGLSSPAPPPRGSESSVMGTMSIGGQGVVHPSARYEARETYAPTYFPGTIADQAARPIDIQAGSDVGGIDINIVTAPHREVRGVILNANTGVPVQYAQLRVSQSSSFPNALSFVPVDPDTGSFEIENMIPGSYMLVASANRMTGRAVVEVGNADVDNVAIRITPGFDLSGRVVFDGQVAAGAHVRIRPEPMVPGLEHDSGIDANGFFVIKQIPPGGYQVTAFPLPDNTYIKSIRFGATDVLTGSLRIDRTADTLLEIVVGANAGALEGRVRGNPNATVVLVPEAAQRTRSGLFKSTFTDESATFRFTGIAPGNYKVFAWEDVEPGAWQDPDFLRPFEDRGVPVRIQEGTTANAAPGVIP